MQNDMSVLFQMHAFLKVYFFQKEPNLNEIKH